MTGPPRLHPEDHADFQAVLHLALSTPGIRSAVSADPTGRATTNLRARALGAADEITAETADEYQEYLAVRAATLAGPQRPAADGTLLPALIVLTPPVAATSAAILLVLGYLLQLTDVKGALPGSLVTAGWVLSLIAAAGTLVALAALLRTAIHRRGGPSHADRLKQVRLRWQQALLDRGMLPHLRLYIQQDPLLRLSAPEQPPPGAPPAGPKSAPSPTHVANTTAASDGGHPKEKHP